MTFREWLAYLWSPARTPAIEDFTPHDEPQADAQREALRASLWRVSPWGRRYFVGHPELASTACRRAALRHHVDIATHGPAKGCVRGVTAGGFAFVEFSQGCGGENENA